MFWAIYNYIFTYSVVRGFLASLTFEGFTSKKICMKRNNNNGLKSERVRFVFVPEDTCLNQVAGPWNMSAIQRVTIGSECVSQKWDQSNQHGVLIIIQHS